MGSDCRKGLLDCSAYATAGTVAWLYLVILWMTWTPTGTSDPEILLRPPSPRWVVVLGNLLLFAPIGFVLGAVGSQRLAADRAGGRFGRRDAGSVEVRRIVLQVAALVAILTVVVELGQLRVQGRTVSPYDVVMNTAGAAAAAWAALFLARRGLDRRILVLGAATSVFLGVVIFLAATGFAASRGLVMDDWNRDHEVLAGDEWGGGREYLGAVDSPRICAGTPPDEWCVEPGADVDARHEVRQAAARTQVVRASAIVTSEGEQSGPARIVTFSRGQDTRNITLGQSGRDLVLRVRTPLGGPNGAKTEFVLPEAVPEGVATEVSAAFESRRAVISVRSSEGELRGDFQWGFFSGWWLMSRFANQSVQPGGLLLAGLLGAAAFALPLGLAAAHLGWVSPALRPLLGLAAAPVLVLLMGAPLNVPTPPRELFAAGGFGLLGGIVAMIGTWRGRGGGRSWLRSTGAKGVGSAAVVLLLLIGCDSTVSGLEPGAGSGVTASDPDRIQPYPGNPFYWQYQGDPVLLLGGSDEDNLFNHPQLPRNGLEAHLDLLQSVGGNYVRNTMSSRDEGNVFPFQGVVREGLYDLTLWNPEYWERFERFLEMTLARDIIVQIELWDRFDFAGGGRWAASPYNPRNNVNYTPETSGLPTVVNSPAPERENPFLRTTPGLDDNQEVLQYQRAFVEKMLSISLHYPHVLYTISNETDESPLWSGYWADLILERAEELARPAYVTEMWAARTPEDPLYENTYNHPERYAYVEISQNNHQVGQAHWVYAMEHRSRLASAPRPINNVKIYGGPRHGGGVEEGTRKFWRNVFAGMASARFHRPHDPATMAGIGLNSLAQTHIRSMRMLTDRMPVFSSEPRTDLLSRRGSDEAYVLAEIGLRYAAYFPDGGSVDLDLSDAAGGMTLRWLDILAVQWGPTISVEGGGSVTLAPPEEGPWVALLEGGE